MAKLQRLGDSNPRLSPVPKLIDIGYRPGWIIIPYRHLMYHTYYEQETERLVCNSPKCANKSSGNDTVERPRVPAQTPH